MRLVRDINTKDKEGFCKTAETLSEYVPDDTKVLTSLMEQFCLEDPTELFMELMPLRFASQVNVSKEMEVIGTLIHI